MDRILIDYGYKTSSGMHQHLERSYERNLVYPAYRIHSVIMLKFLRIIEKYFKLFDCSFFYGSWKKQLDHVKLVVVVANRFTISIVKWINNNYPGIEVHVYYFNILEKDVPLSKFENLKCKFWTFDYEDAKENDQLNLISNVTCFENYKKFPSVMKNEDYDYDAIFIGTDKGRLEQLLALKKLLEKKNFKTLLYVVSSDSNCRKKFNYQRSISYSENVELMANSSIIIDLYQTGQTGATLRSLDAGFLKKKVITNSSSIKREKFYNEHNFFILGEDTDLDNFLSSNYDNQFNFMEYDIVNWIKKFK